MRSLSESYAIAWEFRAGGIGVDGLIFVQVLFATGTIPFDSGAGLDDGLIAPLPEAGSKG